MKPPHFILSVLAALGLLLSSRADDLAQGFRQPPASARPWVFWHWLQGAISREGIDADLAAMQQAGIAGAYLFTVTPPANPPLYTPVTKPLTPEWWDLVRHAATVAGQHGIELSLAVSDGFATAGGPWITPELSMQRVVWSETVVTGGQPFDRLLPQPPTRENFYRDIALLAYPAPVADDPAPVITTSVPDADAQFLATPDGVKQFRGPADAGCWIQYTYTHPFTLRSLVISQWGHNYGGVYHATRLIVEASDDGAHWRHVTRLEPPRHGWQDWGADYTFAVPPTTARFFRFVHDPAGAEPGSEDLNGAKWRPRLILRGLQLSSTPRLPGFEGKSGAVWRRSAPATPEQLPDVLCIPRDRILDLTGRLQPDGRLAWTPPPGRWVLLRLGHTSTGQRNETATAAAGLECDKLNPAAVRLQFDHWFGEALRQLGPDLARRVLKGLHVDSWEAQSQNWTPDFLAAFTRRRGYAPGPLLATFAGVPVGSAAESEKFLADVRQTIADLMTENFFGTLRALAHAHGCTFTAEATAPTMMGDGLRHFAEVDVPMGEFWLRSPQHDKPNDIHDAISGARIYGKTIVAAEAFTELRLQWDEHPALLKPLADRHFAIGINRLALHVFAHNPWLDRRPGLTLGGVGVQFNRDQTWWPDARAWHDYLARCSFLLQQGRPVADVAYFTGEDLPLRAVLPERRSPALPAGYAADSINADALLRLARLEDGRLTLPGGASYAALVVPPGPFSRATEEKLREFAPLLVHPDTGFSRLPPPDLLTTAADLAWIHRSTPSAEIYFLSNQQPGARTIDVSLRPTGRPAELWDPVTGDISTITARTVDSRTHVTLALPAYGSVFLLFPSVASPITHNPSPISHNQSPISHHPSPISAPPAPISDLRPVGGWLVTFDPRLGGPAATQTFATLTDWTAHSNPAIRDYSGSATYTCTFDHAATPGRIWLDLGTVHNLARVFVNGIDCGTAWTAPWRVEITAALRPGKNRLELRVTNTWANRLRADRNSTAPVTWTSAPALADAPPLPAGLLGPVRLLHATP